MYSCHMLHCSTEKWFDFQISNHEEQYSFDVNFLYSALVPMSYSGIIILEHAHKWTLSFWHNAIAFNKMFIHTLF